MKQFGLFMLAAIGGIILISLCYQFVQVSEPGDVSDIFLREHTLSENHKVLITTQSALSQWLMGLAYAALIGLFSVKCRKGVQSDSVQGTVETLGCALMLISLFGGFLYYEGTAHALAKGPPSDLYKARVIFPIIVQFYSLLIGVLLLAYRFLFKTSVIIAAILLFRAPPAAYAQTPPSPTSQDQLQRQRLYENLENAYQIKLDVESQEALSELTEKMILQSEVKLGPEDQALFVEMVASKVRGVALEDDRLTVDQAILALYEESQSPGLNPSDLFQELKLDLDFWHRQTGALRIISEIGTVDVLMNQQKVGVTNCVFRLRVNSYLLQFVKNGKYLKQYEEVVLIEEGKIKEINLERN